MTPQGTQWRASNATLRTLIRFAYGSDDDPSTPALLEEYRLVGGPTWIGSEAFDIEARMPEGPRRLGDSALMLRALLAERFSLKVHGEIREFPAYALVRARGDGPPPAGLRATSGTCISPIEPVRPDQRPCRMRGAFEGLIGESASMALFGRSLTPLVGRPVVDRTGLEGSFDFSVRFTENPRADSRFPSIFTALQEQLGLRLESIRAPLEVLVIDGVERPTEN